MSDQELAHALFNAGLLTAEQIQIVAARRTAEKNFAQAVVEMGWLTPAQIAQFDPNALRAPAPQGIPPQGMPPPGMPPQGMPPQGIPPQAAPPMPPGTPYGSPPTSPYASQGAPPASPYGASGPSPAPAPFGMPSAPYGAPSTPYGASPYGSQPYGAPPYGTPPYGSSTPGGYGGVVPGRPKIDRKAGVVDLSAISQGWELVSSQIGMWIVTILVMRFILGIWSQIVGLPMQFSMPRQPQFNPQDIWGSLIAAYAPSVPYFMLSIVLQIPLYAFLQGGAMMVALKQMRRGTVELTDLFGAGPYFWPLLGASILMQIAMLLGFLGFCIGAFIVGGLFMLTTPLVLERNLHPVEAMEQSWKTLQGQVGSAALLMLVLSLLQIAGLMVCCVGVFLTMPLVYTTTAVLYDRFYPMDEMPLPTPTDPSAPPPIPSPF